MTHPLRLLAVTLLAALLGSAAARAAVCASDSPPAATLLLPYFEVDLGDPNGVNTLFSVNNASDTAVLANVVLWTDLGIPTLSFPVYLTGYDVVTVSLRDVFAGLLPETASHGQDPGDAVSPQGPFSQDVDFASCTGHLALPPLPPAAVSDLQRAHRGFPSGPAQLCSGIAFGDSTVRGYLTVDTVNGCSLTVRSPRDAGYFGAGGSGRATAQNVLWGDFFLVDAANNFAQGDNLVRIEAAPGAFAPGELTFYGRFVGYSGSDEREPLSTVWATRFVDGGGFDGGTDLRVWRDPENPGEPWPPVGGVCSAIGSVPWFPLSGR